MTTKSAFRKLWYNKPATDWENESLPIGNGRLGAMIFGGLGSTMDMSLIRELFRHCIEAGETLGEDADFRVQHAASLAKLLPDRTVRPILRVRQNVSVTCEGKAEDTETMSEGIVRWTAIPNAVYIVRYE